MGQTDTSEGQIIDQAIEGNESALRYLLERYKGFAFTIAIRIVKNREDAEEIVQDSFIKAFKALKKFKRSGKFSTWLYKITYNTALTSKRKGKLETNPMEEYLEDKLSIPDNYSNGFLKLKNDDQEKYLKIAIGQLDDTDKLLVTLYYTCEMSISEVTEITGWNGSTIKVRLHRARQKLYNNLSELLKHEMKDLL